MKQTLTLVCKLHPTPEQVAKIEATLKAFADGCNHVNQVVKPNMTNKVAIQAQTYEQLRSQFGLSANLAVRVCARVAANRKTAKAKGKPVRAFGSTSADYDARIFAFREKDWTVSLTLVGGREHIPMQVGNYQIVKLKGRKPTNCGWHGDADFNGSMNIAAIGAVVSLLRGSETLSCSISLGNLGLLKAPAF
jgi:transposase